MIVQIAFGNPYVSVAVGLGYIIGESFGWGEWVGNLTTHRRNTTETLEDEGESNGIKYIATRIVSDWANNYLRYCRVALVLRGAYWWLPTLAPLYFVGFNPLFLAGCITFLSIGFPIACELGYYFRDKVSFEKFGLSYSGGWELQEGFYGMLQDIVLIGVIVWKLMN